MIKPKYKLGEYFIKKEIEGSLNEKEARVLNRFVEQEINSAESDTKCLDNSDEIGIRIKQHIDSKLKEKQNPRRLWVWYAAAASVILFLGIIGLKSFSTKTHTFKTLATIDSLQLQDGSKIILSPNSKISYDDNYNKAIRSITLLEGNAFFEVAKNPQKPFEVYSNDIKTTVLGTSFNVRMDPDEIAVSVRTGKVKVTSPIDEVALLPNEKANYNLITNSLKKETSQYFQAWYTSHVNLNSASFQDVAKILEKRFGYPIQYESEDVKGEKITVQFTETDSIESVLKRLNYITNLNFNIKANEIEVIKPNKSN